MPEKQRSPAAGQAAAVGVISEIEAARHSPSARRPQAPLCLIRNPELEALLAARIGYGIAAAAWHQEPSPATERLRLHRLVDHSRAFVAWLDTQPNPAAVERLILRRATPRPRLVLLA